MPFFGESRLYISTIQDTAIKSHSIYSLPLLGQFGNVQKCSDDEMETPVYKAVRNSNIDGRLFIYMDLMHMQTPSY